MKFAADQRWHWPAVISLLVGLYLLPRLINLDASVTTDEPIWLGRSANFYMALYEGHLADTFQFAHPGVTTMWAGMVGYWFVFPSYVTEYSGNFPLTFEIHQRIRAAGLSELDVLIATRISKILLQAIFFMIAIAFCQRRFGTLVALLTGIIIALDPFLIGNDQVLHVDGLFAISSFAAAMALANAFVIGPSQTRPWVIAGILAALAWLTRSTGLALIVVLAGWLLLDFITARRQAGKDTERRVWFYIRPALFWLGAALITTFALWPALWVAPRTTLSFVVDWAADAATAGHSLPTFFNGRIYPGDAGLLFYPITMLWRLTPVTLLGAALCVGLLIAGAVRAKMPNGTIRALAVVGSFALIYLIGMSLGDKKFDRYILPVYPFMEVVAALGFATMASIVGDTVRRHRRLITAGALALAVLFQGASYLTVFAYPLNYYNPLLGGLSSAVDEVQVGWGETDKEAAEYILDHAERDDVTVRMSGSRGPLLYFMPEPAVVQPHPFKTVADWQATDYYVSSVQHWQRDIYNDIIGYLERFEPVHVITIDGVPFNRIYDLNQIPAPPFLPESDGCYQDFMSIVLLEQVSTNQEGMTLWFRTISKTPPAELIVTVTLIPRSGGASNADNPTWSARLDVAQQYRTVEGVSLDIETPDGVPLDQFWLSIAVNDPETGENLSVSDPGAMLSSDSALLLPTCGDQNQPDDAQPAPGNQEDLD